jgi:hypothetical protein
MSAKSQFQSAREASPEMWDRTAIFCIPKDFSGPADLAQRNAIGSWLQLLPPERICLLGNGRGMEEVAAQYAVRHEAGLACNSHGTPLLSDAFARASTWEWADVLVYANADIILRPDFRVAVAALERASPEPYLAFGQRVDVRIDWLIDWSRSADLSRLDTLVRAGRPESKLCKDYFAFRRGWFTDLPRFAVGRGNWDNWMVWMAKRMELRTVDLSLAARAIHSEHDHDHVPGGRAAAYVRGAEARENQRLAGGRHWIGGSTGEWMLGPSGLRRVFCPQLHGSFWRESGRAARLAWRLARGR